MFMISKYPRFINGEHRRFNIQNEIDDFYELMSYTRKLFKGEIYFIRGNHCDRLEKYIATKATEIGPLRSLDLPELLRLSDFHSIFVKKWLIIPPPFNGLIYHGIFTGENASKRELLRHNCNLICGHSHRTAFYEANSFFGKISCWHLGSLADKSALDEACKYSEYSYQSQSFGILSMNRERFNVDVVNCEATGFQYQGRFYQKVY